MLHIYKRKSDILRSIRDHFYQTEAIEVITDIAQEYPNLDPNVYPVEVNLFNERKGRLKRYLHTSPEIQMKKILSKVKSHIFQITKVFRNFEGSKKHKIEFTMLEWYRVGYSLDDLMEDTKEIFLTSCRAVHCSDTFFFRGKKYNLRDWDKVSVDEAFYRYTGCYPDIDSLNSFLREKEGLLRPIEEFEEIFYRVYAFYVEPRLGAERPVFIYDYPPEFAALSRVVDGKGKRFEAYIDGIELVNGYWELNDHREQRRRFEEEVKKKRREGFEYTVDEEFVEAVKELPECSGASLGIDRLFMVMFDREDIHF
ncbi:MAG: elongation factor P--(R)-beta-lysine ligase [Hydrogenothermaceae bacterium]|nr:elongation factor P--(R)-beta-lysine ligase [Hydrogenothermaceae bacterium]